MITYFHTKTTRYQLSGTEKTSVNLRLDRVLVEKCDEMALKEQRSRNFIINRLLSDLFQIMAKTVRTATVKPNRSKRLKKKNRHDGKTCVSLRLENRLLKHIDVIASVNECSRNFAVNRLLNKMMKIIGTAE